MIAESIAEKSAHEAAYLEACKRPCNLLRHLYGVKPCWSAKLVAEIKPLVAEEARIWKAITDIDAHVEGLEARRNEAVLRTSKAGSATEGDYEELDKEPIEAIRERYRTPKRHLLEQMQAFQDQKVRPILFKVVGELKTIVAAERAKFATELKSINDRLGLPWSEAHDQILHSIDRWLEDAIYRLIGRPEVDGNGLAKVRAVLGDAGPC